MQYEFHGTQGPWKAVDNSWDMSCVESCGTGKTIAWCPIDEEEVTEDNQEYYEAIKEADACMLGASKSLFDSLKGILEALDKVDIVYGEEILDDAVDEAKKSLCKATSADND